jgi:hypothetical protein
MSTNDIIQMGEKSIVAKASSKSSSVRTAVPEKIVQEMEIWLLETYWTEKQQCKAAKESLV